MRDACRGCEVPRRRSRNERMRCVFCPSPNADSLILDCDRMRAFRGIRGVINDCIVVKRHGALHMAMVEFKGGSYSSEHVKSQLVAGANLALDMLDALRHGRKVRLHLVIVAPSHSYAQRRFVCYRQATVCGKKLPTHTVRCGTAFSRIISGACLIPDPDAGTGIAWHEEDL